MKGVTAQVLLARGTLHDEAPNSASILVLDEDNKVGDPAQISVFIYWYGEN